MERKTRLRGLGRSGKRMYLKPNAFTCYAQASVRPLPDEH